MTEKDELEAYAREKFGVDLDKRRSIKTLKAQIQELEEGVTDGNDSGPEEDKEVSSKKEIQKEKVLESAQSLANRIWTGQSVSLPEHVRKSRIISRLKDKGYSDAEIDKLEL